MTNKTAPGATTLLVVFTILILRFVSIGWLALSDPTESRYADIALRMHQSKDFVMPWVVVDGRSIPYWGKPPLHFWLTSLSYAFFGISEWSARFPGFLAGLLTALLTWQLASRLWNRRVAALSLLILTSSPLFFFVYGASAVDATLSAAITGAMASFALAVAQRNAAGSQKWGLLFFVFLAMGMLVKGPVAPALVALAILLWVVMTKQQSLLRAIPWKYGIPLFLLLSVPWFILAELRTPGFLRYFLIHEHILRYLVHEYGDKYGSGHLYPRGTSWFMLLATFLPWSILLVYIWIKKWNAFRCGGRSLGTWSSYLMTWGIAPAMFFMLSRQLLATYVLPGFGGLSIAVALALTEFRLDRIRKAVPVIGLGFVAVYTAVMLAFGAVADDRVSSKGVYAFLSSDPDLAARPVVFAYEEPYSAQFYEQMLLHREHRFNEDRREALMQRLLGEKSNAVFVFREKHWAEMGERLQARLVIVHRTANWILCTAR